MPLAGMSDDELWALVVARRVMRARGEGVEAVAAFGEHVFGLRPAAHHVEWMEERLRNKRVATVAPPESAKTTWTEILDAWWIGKHPETSNGVGSATDVGALKMAQVVVECIERNPRWGDVFPEVVPDKERGWSREGWWVRDREVEAGEWARRMAARKDPTLIAGGVGAAVWAGVRITGRLSLDDIHDRESKTSQAVCDDTVGFVKDTALSRVTDEAYLDIEQTRWNARDVIAYVKGLPHFKVFEHPAWTVVAGERVSYWPEQWPLERLESKRAEIGSLDFELQFLGNVAALRGKVLRSEWLVPFPAHEINPAWPCLYGFDPAFKTLDLVETRQRKRSRAAIAKYVLAPFGLVLADVYAGHWTVAEAEENLVRYASFDRPKRIGIEVTGVGEPFYQSMLLRTSLPLERLKALRDTVARVSEMAPDYEFGRVRVSDALTGGLNLFRDEWLTLGEAGASDDTLSAAYWGWRVASYSIGREDRSGREARPPAPNPFQQIEMAYGGRRITAPYRVEANVRR